MRDEQSYFVMNIVDMLYGTRRTVLTIMLMTQLVDICGDMWRVITRANSSHIVGKLVTLDRGLKVIIYENRTVCYLRLNSNIQEHRST